MHAPSLNIPRRCALVFMAAGLWADAGRPVVNAQKPTEIARVNSSDGTPIAYQITGAGAPALVFVHGWSCDRGYWAGQIEPLSRQFTVVAIDLAGHGESGLGRKNFSMESFGDDVAAVVNRLGLQRVVLIGHSMGGDVVPE